MAENFLTLGKEFLVKTGLLYEVTGRLGLFGQGRHGDHGEAGLKLHGIKVVGDPIEKITLESKTSQYVARSCASSCFSPLPFSFLPFHFFSLVPTIALKMQGLSRWFD